MSSSDLRMMEHDGELTTAAPYGPPSHCLSNSGSAVAGNQEPRTGGNISHATAIPHATFLYQQPSSSNSSLAGALGPVLPSDSKLCADNMGSARNADNHTPSSHGSSSTQSVASSSSAQLQNFLPSLNTSYNNFTHPSMFDGLMMQNHWIPRGGQESQQGTGMIQNFQTHGVHIQAHPGAQQTLSMGTTLEPPAGSVFMPQFIPGFQPWGILPDGNNMSLTGLDFVAGLPPEGIWSPEVPGAPPPPLTNQEPPLSIGRGPEASYLYVDERFASANIQLPAQWAAGTYGNFSQPFPTGIFHGVSQADSAFNHSQAPSDQENTGADVVLPPIQQEQDATMAPPATFSRPRSEQWSQPKTKAGEIQTNPQSSSREGQLLQTTFDTHTSSTAKTQLDAPQAKKVEVKDGAMTPRPATTSLAGAMYNQCNRYYRYSHNETCRLLHNAEPPTSMNILTTSALERSKIGGAALEAGLKADKQKSAAARTHTPPGESIQAGAGGNAVGVAQAQVSPPPSQQSESSATIVPAVNSFMAEANFFPEVIGDNWVPAKSGAQIFAESAAEAARLASVSPQTPGLPTPLDNPATQSQDQQRSLELDADDKEVRSKTLRGKVLPLLRHDVHLASHVSGLGGTGTFSEAYDGCSFIPDDAEQDPNHLSPPPGARLGDHPLLLPHKPRPLHDPGQKVHRLMEPPSSTASRLAQLASEKKKDEKERAQRKTANTETDDPEAISIFDEALVDDEAAEIENKLDEEVTEKDRQGSACRFVESNSHGLYYKTDLVSEDEMRRRAEATANAPPRLRLSTEKKVAPKLACQFCRQRKIACGPGTETHTCNQCEKRGHYCVFPTESRRGMRTKRRSQKTAVNEDILDFDDDGAHSPPATASARRGRGSGRGGRGRGTVRKRGRPRASSTANEVQDASGGREDAIDIEMDEDEQSQGEPAQLVSGKSNDPLSLFNAELSPLEPPPQGTYLHPPILARGDMNFSPNSMQPHHQGQPFVNEYADTYQYHIDVSNDFT